MNSRTEAVRALARAYHKAWTGNDHERFHAMLADDVQFEFPMEVKWPDGARISLIAEVVDGDTAVQIYDATSPGGATVRMAEHLTFQGDKVRRIVPVFDHAAMRQFMAR